MTDVRGWLEDVERIGRQRDAAERERDEERDRFERWRKRTLFGIDEAIRMTRMRPELEPPVDHAGDHRAA